jgi:hypothetical protein
VQVGTRLASRRRTPAGLAVLLVLALLSGCSALADVAAPRGLRRGTVVPSRSHGVPSQPLHRAPAGPVGEGGYAFLATHPDGTPVTWDPCRPVHYVVRPDGAPRDGAQWLRWAFGVLRTASGLRFVDDGATREAPAPERPAYLRATYGDRWAPVLVTWSSPVETPLITDDVLGRAGPRSFSAHGARELRWVSGSAVFNGPALDRMLATGDEAKVQAVLLHELGHLVGLGHVPDPYQVMYDTNAYPVSAYRAGDLRGLSLLGAGRCYRDY